MNLFVGSGDAADPAAVEAYAARLAALSERAGVALGTPRFDDDEFAAKVDALVADPVAVVSFTFGLPPADALARLRGAGSRLWLTVTSPEEALAAIAVGAGRADRPRRRGGRPSRRLPRRRARVRSRRCSPRCN